MSVLVSLISFQLWHPTAFSPYVLLPHNPFPCSLASRSNRLNSTSSPIISFLCHCIVSSTSTPFEYLPRAILTQAQLSVSSLIGEICQPMLWRILYSPSFLSAQLMKSPTDLFFYFNFFHAFRTEQRVTGHPSLPFPSQTLPTMHHSSFCFTTTQRTKSKSFR